MQRLRPHRAQSRIAQLPLPPRARSRSRSASGRSRATNRRARGLFSLSLVIPAHATGRRRTDNTRGVAKACRLCLQRRLVVAEQDAQQVHADQGRALADVGAAAGDDRVAGQRGAVGEAGVEADVADRLLLAAAVGAGDAGDRDGDIGLEALAGRRSPSPRRPRARPRPWPRSSPDRRRAGSAFASFE